jgi:hypothetical protein
VRPVRLPACVRAVVGPHGHQLPWTHARTRPAASRAQVVRARRRPGSLARLEGPADTTPVWRAMGRAPCCEKVGLKRGRWTAEEDQLLANYIAEHGEGSWRSLPKNAGNQSRPRAMHRHVASISDPCIYELASSSSPSSFLAS